jgi:hypothetical protein
VDNPEIGKSVEVSLNGNNNSFAELEIPALEVPAGVGTVFGIARNAIVGGDRRQGQHLRLSARSAPTASRLGRSRSTA